MIREFDPLIYPRKIWVYIGKDYEEVKDYFQDSDIKNMPDQTLGYVQNTHRKETNMGGILIWFRSKKEIDASTITHESLHSALEIFDFIGGKVDNQNQEYICYLAGWIAECIEKTKNGK